jgi:hypothetical protein
MKIKNIKSTGNIIPPQNKNKSGMKLPATPGTIGTIGGAYGTLIAGKGSLAKKFGVQTKGAK